MNLDLSNPNNKLIFDIVGSIAEWEKQIISARTREGLAYVREKGKVLGRSKRDDIPISDVLRMRQEGIGWGIISKQLKIPVSLIRDHVSKVNGQLCENTPL